MVISVELRSGVYMVDVVAALKADGYDVVTGPWTLRHAVKRGRIPKPFRTFSGQYAWQESELAAIWEYFKSPVKPGRPRKVLVANDA